MPYTPVDQDELYEDIRDRIIERTEKLTNFEEGSLNHTLAYHGFAGYFSRFEHLILAVQLSGWIETAGGPIREDDLIRLDIPPERIDLELLNSYMDDRDLDELALQNGVRRDPGGRARGEVAFQTIDSTVTVPAGTEVTNSPSRADEPRLRYRTTNETSPPDGETEAIAMVEAVDVGSEYNVGPRTIDEMSRSPSGVREVTNPEPITGGEPPETNRELRQRAKAAIVQRSGGGTVEGIRGGIVERVEGVDADNIYIEEHYDPPSGSPYVEVIVSGGDEDEVENAIEALHPTGIRHLMRRPTAHVVDITVELTGSPINRERVEGEISRYLSELGIGDDVNRAALITAIMNADEDITNIESLIIESDRDGRIEGDLSIAADEVITAGDFYVELI